MFRNIYIYISSSGHLANKPFADSMPVHRLRRRSGTKSALPMPMPIRRVYLTAAHIIMVLPSKHETPTRHRADVSCLPGMNLSAHIHTKQAEIYDLPVQCWSTVYDNGPASNKQGIPGSSWLWLKKKTRDAAQQTCPDRPHVGNCWALWAHVGLGY